MPYTRLTLCVLLFVGAIVAFLVGEVRDRGKTYNLRKYGVAGVLLGVLFLAWSCVRIVPANTVGIPTTFGSIGKSVGPGLKPVSPFTEVNTFSTRLQESSMLAANDEGDKEKDDSIETRGSDGYASSVDVTIRYFVGAESASDLFRRVGSMDGIRDRIVRPETREGVRVVFGKYTAEEGYTGKREQISNEINDLMRERLEKYGLILDGINIRNVNPEERLRTAIGERAIARENAAKAEIAQRQQITEAETRKQVAERDAASRQISAQAEAEANAKISGSLTPALLQQEYNRALKEANTIYVPSNSQLLVDGRPPAPRP